MMLKTFGHPYGDRLEGALLPVIVLLLVLWAGYLVLDVQMAQYLPIALFLTCAFGAARMMHRTYLAVWSPVLWFLLASAVYYGIGPLIYVSGESAIIDYAQGYYAVDEQGIANVNQLNTFSIFLICVVYELSLRTIRTAIPSAAVYDPEPQLRKILIFFILISYSVRMGIVVARQAFGMEVVIDGIWFSLAELGKVAVLLATYGFASGYRWAVPMFLVVAGVELFLAIGSLMKQNVLEVLFVVFLGIFFAKPSRKVILGAAAMAIAIYVVLVPIFSAARNVFWVAGPVDMSTEIAIAGSILGGENQSYDGVLDSLWWSRLVYTPAQAFAMDSYDVGNSGRTFAMAPFTLIPRILWPEKPIMTYGEEFTRLVQGDSAQHSTAAGYFGEAYWNYGWAGVVLMALLTGIVYAFFTRFNVARIVQRDIRWMPIAYLSLKMGYRPDDWFVTTMIGTIPIMVAFWIVLRLFVPATMLVPTNGKKARWQV